MRHRKLDLVGQNRLGHGGLEQIDLPGSMVGNSERADLSGGLQMVEGAGHFFRLHECVGPVQQ
ncbi:hypothetical protein D3C76_1598710 [compost metagenome]